MYLWQRSKAAIFGSRPRMGSVCSSCAKEPKPWPKRRSCRSAVGGVKSAEPLSADDAPRPPVKNSERKGHFERGCAADDAKDAFTVKKACIVHVPYHAHLLDTERPGTGVP